MRAFWAVMLLILAPTLHADAPGTFALRTQGDQVCKVVSGQAQPCYPTFTAQFGKANVPNDSIELMADVHAYAATLRADGTPGLSGAIFLQPADVQTLDQNFKSLLLHNIGLDLGALKQARSSSDTPVKLPFLASLDWVDTSVPANSGSLNVEGYLEFEVLASNSNIQNLDELRKLIRVFHITDFCDANDSALQARRLHFVKINAAGLSEIQIDAQSTDWLEQQVGPLAFADVFVVPLAREVGHAIGDAVSKAIQDGLDQLFNNGKNK